MQSTTTHLPATETPSPPSFRGHLFFNGPDGIVELRQVGLNEPLSIVPVINQTGVASPLVPVYQNSLLYVDTSHNVVILKDLYSGLDRDLFGLMGTPLSQEDLNWYGGTIECLSWSNDGSWISFVNLAGELFLFKMDSTADPFIVYTPPSAIYALGGYGPGESHHGSTSCASWIATDKLVFESFSGEVPSQITAGSGDFLPNTTFLAELQNGTWRTIDQTNELLGNLQASPDGSTLIYSEYDEAGTLKLLSSTPIESFEQLTKQPLPVKGDLPPSIYPFDYKFTSDGTGIIIQETIMDAGGVRPSLKLVNLKTLTEQAFFQVPASWQVKEKLFWLGDPADGLVGFYREEDKESFLLIGDLKTSLLTRYAIDISQTSTWKLLGSPPVLVFLAWLP